MIHYKTKNTSFLKVHLFLKKKGVKNNAFFLELYDETLEDIDPFDYDNLTEETKQRILIECSKNFWYFIRECVRISASGTSRYELNLGNLALSWACLNNLNSVTIMPRQCGKTFAAMGVLTWVLYFGGYKTEMMLVAQAAKNIANNMGRIRSIRDNLPKYLILRDNKDRDGAELIDFKPLGNKITNTTPGLNETAADSKGRGLSIPVLQADETSFAENFDVFYKAGVLAQTTVAKRAQANGLPNFISFTTTAGYLNNKSGIWMHQFILDSFQFSEKLYDYPVEQIRDMIRNEAIRNFLYIEYQYWDLGKDDSYFKEQCQALNYDQDAIDREVLNKWKAVSTAHPLGQNALHLLESNKKNPIHIVVINKIFRLKMYRDPEKLDWSIPYVICGDCANNVGSDYSALVVIDPYTYEVVATMRTNMFSTMLFAKAIADLMRHYFYRSVLVLEKNLNGTTIMDRLVEISYDLASRIYGPVDKKTGEIKEFGFSTVKQSRDILYGEILKIAVDDSYDRIYDKIIIDEISALIRTRNGRIDHPQGGHDDLLISYLIGRWFLLYGDNRERYIDPLMIGCALNEFSENKGKPENEMRSVIDKRLTEIEDDKKEQEKEIKRKKTLNSGMEISAGKSLMTLEEQNEAIMNDSYGKRKNTGYKQGSANGLFGNLFGMMNDRYDADIKDQINEQDDRGTMYTLDDEELKKENDKLYDDNYQQEQYNRNMREDMGINAKPVNSNIQYIRKKEAEHSNNDADELRYFFSHLR